MGTSSAAKLVLDHDLIAQLLGEAQVSWPVLSVVAVTGSTNSDLASQVRAGTAREGSVRVAGAQTAGRGRLGRRWESPPGGSLSWSVVLKPPATQIGFAPILVGMAVARAVIAETNLAAQLKWPNDVQIQGRKLAGLLSERIGDAVVVGCGMNIGVASSDLDSLGATSLVDQGVARSRERILVACLDQLGTLLARWREGSYSPVGSGLLADYRKLCCTIGQNVEVELPGGRRLTGLARDVDEDARLEVVTSSGTQVVDAGDVTHVRSK
jgi:BirA family biotin operon repressor/biotin-[acetyl-CoA-carboxylase] ligase